MSGDATSFAAHALSPSDTRERDGEAPAAEIARLAMWVFVASEGLFFGGLFVAYGVARWHNGAGFAAASRHTDVLLGTLNTAVLLASSAVVAMAVAAAEHARSRLAARLLWLAVTLALAFLGLKGIEYAQDVREHLVPGRRFALADTPGAALFYAFYFLATGLHALHLVIGAALLAVFAWGARRDRPWYRPRRLDVAALYWHFVDVVWIFLYPLLYLVQRHG